MTRVYGRTECLALLFLFLEQRGGAAYYSTRFHSNSHGCVLLTTVRPCPGKLYLLPSLLLPSLTSTVTQRYCTVYCIFFGVTQTVIIQMTNL